MPSIDSILIVGAGWTGRQIAAQCAAHGIAVAILDNRPASACESVEWSLKHAASLSQEQTWAAEAVELCRRNLRAVDELSDVTWQVDLALECVPEQPSVKRRVLNELSSRFDKSTIVASNSSYFTPSMLNKYVAVPERFAHLHFHAPIWMATVVDIVPGPQAEPNVVARLKEFALRIGQTPLVQTVENSGYVFNDILRSMLTKALELAERGVAVPEDIEATWKKITGMRVGPFGMMDWIGIDLIQQALQHARWQGDYQQTQKLVDFLQPWIDRGDLGVKVGRGFFSYDQMKTESDG